MDCPMNLTSINMIVETEVGEPVKTLMAKLGDSSVIVTWKPKSW